MTKKMEIQTRPDAPMEWRHREDIDALAKRLQKMLPGQTLNREESLLLAQYAGAMDANPFRGEIYAYTSRGKLVLTEGYKLLVRWARRQCQFSERYEELTGDELPERAIGYRCWILREDNNHTIATLCEAGAPWDQAFEIAAQSAVGIVTKADRTKRNGQPLDPPKGWTWEEVARKRALKNALNRAYGAPSPKEIARETWMVDDTETTLGDWIEAAEELPEGTDPEHLADMAGRIADHRQNPITPEEAQEGAQLLFPPDDGGI